MSPTSTLHPFMVPGVLLCGGYITSWRLRKRTQPSPFTHTHTHKKKPKKSIQKNSTRSGAPRACVGGAREKTQSCSGAPENTGLSATVTIVRAGWGSCAIWGGESRCRSGGILGLHLEATGGMEPSPASMRSPGLAGSSA